MDSGIMRNMLIFPSLQEVCNILVTVRIITIIPSVKKRYKQGGRFCASNYGGKKVTFSSKFSQVALHEIWEKMKGWVRQILRSARSLKWTFPEQKSSVMVWEEIQGGAKGPKPFICSAVNFWFWWGVGEGGQPVQPRRPSHSYHIAHYSNFLWSPSAPDMKRIPYQTPQ